MLNRDFGRQFASLGNCSIKLDDLFIQLFQTNLSKNGKVVQFEDESKVNFSIQNISKNVSLQAGTAAYYFCLIAKSAT